MSRPSDLAATFPKIVLTGGPGAGKTAVQNVAARLFGKRIVCVPEAATILFSGGFPRHGSLKARQAAQRGIFWIQRELEALHIADAPAGSTLLCDRGTVDGQAYWEGEEDFWSHVGSSPEQEYARYHTIVHLRVPEPEDGYNDHPNPVRTESPEEAARIDARIAAVWAGHPRVIQIPSTENFVLKVEEATERIGAALALIVRGHSGR